MLYLFRSLGSFKPRFEGKPQDYWELSNFDIYTALAMLLIVTAAMVALSIGCMYLDSFRVVKSIRISMVDNYDYIRICVFVLQLFMFKKQKIDLR
jgi:uncharacterized membrane protein YoaT (DUF817 family)